ncbi:unnamed protein product [Prorocentrum cordatum]|uniref:Uncharacterized protein n=1 Tax=Prorocentrum cordatum TaxID=2364126 RepID=A0ABN9SE45_9DINO|nr:unnamed protein product [Polarella glacialis]
MGQGAFVAQHLEAILEEHRRLLARIPRAGDLQSSWLLLSMCANPRANFFLRALAPEDTAAFAAAHDDNLANALADLLTAPAAWWASWADCAQMLRERCPDLTNQICAALSELDRGPLPAAPGCLQQASRAKEHLSAHGFAAPNWHDLAQGARAGGRCGRGPPVWGSSGGLRGRPCPGTERSRPGQGLERSRGFEAEATAGVGSPARGPASRREPGRGPSRREQLLRDLNVDGVDPRDGRKIEVIANGLPLWGGAQLAIDATLVSPVRTDGTAQPRAADEDGVQLAVARGRKEATYPELIGSRRCRLVVLGLEVGGKWSEEALTFVGLLARARARSAPQRLRASARAAYLHRWTGLVAVAAQRAFAATLLELPPHTLAVDGDEPHLADLLADARYTETPEAYKFLVVLARARARGAPAALRGSLTTALLHRWAGMLSFAIHDALAASLLEDVPSETLATDGVAPRWDGATAHPPAGPTSRAWDGATAHPPTGPAPRPPPQLSRGGEGEGAAEEAEKEAARARRARQLALGRLAPGALLRTLLQLAQAQARLAGRKMTPCPAVAPMDPTLAFIGLRRFRAPSSLAVLLPRACGPGLVAADARYPCPALLDLAGASSRREGGGRMSAGSSGAPLTALRDLVNRWIGVETKRLERGAALCDVLALLACAPPPPLQLAAEGKGEAGPLIDLGRQVRTCLAHEVPGPALVFAAVCPAPGGDVATWSAILDALARLRSRSPHASFLVAGDASIHLSDILMHQPGCSCCHCRQSQGDRTIEAMLSAAGLFASSPPVPTRDSGTCIDLVLAGPGQAVSVTVKGAVAMCSDHRLLCWSLACQCDRSTRAGFGRVSWRADSQWDHALLQALSADAMLQALGQDLQARASLGRVSAAALGEVTPGPRAAAELAGWVSGGPTEADRAAVHDALGTGHLQPLQFSDDLSVVRPSPGALRAVVSAEPDSACGCCAMRLDVPFGHADARACNHGARLPAQPADHPGARMLSLARSLSCTTWASVAACRRVEQTPPVLDIDVHPAFRHALRNARCSVELRPSLLRSFQLQVVRLALRARDLAAFQRAACARLPALGMSNAALFRMWAVARMSGAWPLPVLGVPSLPVTLARCAACGALQVDIAYALCGCPGQTMRRAELETRALLPPLSQAGVYMYQLFRDGPPPEQRWHRVLFVARALHDSIGPRAFCHREAA